MKKRKIFVGLLAFSALLSVTSCEKKDKNPDNQDQQQEQELTVTLNSMGGSEVSTSIFNGYVVEPADPKKDGVYFVQWCTDEACETPFDFSKKVTESITLYAQWRDPYDIVCNFYVGDTKFATTTTKEDTKVVMPTTEPEHPTNSLYKQFNAWYTTSDESKQNSKTKWDDKKTVNSELNLYAGFKTRETTVEIKYGTEQINAIKSTDDIQYKNFYFKSVLGAETKKETDCLKSGGNTLIKVTETSRLTITVASGSSNTVKQWVALIKATEYDPDTFNVDAGKGKCVVPSNKESDSLTVSNDGKITIVSANSGFTTLIFSDLEAGNYILTSGSSNSFIQDSTADRGTNLIPEIKLEKVTELTPIKEIKLSTACPKYHIFAGRELDLSNVLINAEYENESVQTLDYTEATKLQDVYGSSEKKVPLTFDTSAVNLDEAGTYTVAVKYINPYDGAEYTLDGGITVNVYETESLKLGDYKLDSNGIAKATPKVFVSKDFSSSNLVVIAEAKCGELKKEFVLTSDEFDVQAITELTKGENTVTVTSGEITTNYKVYYLDKIVTKDTITINVDATKDIAVDAANKTATFKTITDALTYLRACELKDSVVKTINLADGTYNEKVEFDLPNLVVNGNATDATKVVITYNALAGSLDPSGSIAHGTNGCATVSIRPEAVGFKANNLTIANYYNTFEKYEESKKITNDTQAVAALVQADQSVFKNVRFSGYHDTLFAQVGRQYYEDCYIEGRTDYIFGYNATAYFKDCDIYTIGAYKMVDDQKVFEDNGGYVIATKGNKSNTDTDGIEFGYIFDNCNFTAEEGVKDQSVALGRTWANNMTVMIMNSTLSAAYSKKAYTSTLNYGSRYTKMKNDAPNADKLLEYNNTGDGAVTLDNQEDLLDTCTIIDTQDADLAAILAKYEATHLIFGAVNGKVKYDTPWNDPNVATNATVTVKFVGVTAADQIVYNGWIGSTVTNAILNAAAEEIIPIGYELNGFYSDAECTTAYNDSTVLTAENTIYLKVNKLGIETTKTYLHSNETNEGWTLAGTDGTLKIAATIGEAYVSDGNNVELPKLVPAVTDAATNTTTPASTLSYTVGSSQSVYLKVITGTSGTGKAATLTVLGYDTAGNIVASATGTTPADKKTDYVTAEDGTTTIGLKSNGNPIAKVVIMNNDSTIFTNGKGLAIYSVELKYYMPDTNAVTDEFSFNWEKISTAKLTSTGSYTLNPENGAELAEEDYIVKYDNAWLSNETLLDAFGDKKPALTIITENKDNYGVVYRDGAKYWKDASATKASSNPKCIELKGMPTPETKSDGTNTSIGGINVTIKGKGTITVAVASTGGSNCSAIGLLDSNGDWIKASNIVDGVKDDVTYTATLIEEGVMGGKTDKDANKVAYPEYCYGAYTVSNTVIVTITFTVTKPGTYTLASPAVTNNRGIRIFNLDIKDTYIAE